MSLSRVLKIPDISEKKSILLLGPRQTGKSTLLRQQAPEAPQWNLLDASVFRRLSADPTKLRTELLAISPRPELVVIDEVQRLPVLLDEVHLLIEEHGFRFVLTGSSARALKRKGANLLGGRARIAHLHPFVTCEIGETFDLLRALNHGLLPPIYLGDEPDADLADYAGTYLREEVAAEGLSRNIPGFSRFLEVAALCNGQQINFTTLASDAQVKRTTVVDWYEVLKDTLLVHELPAWTGSRKRKAMSTAKFYFFDVGVARYLAGRGSVTERGKDFGDAFEHLVHLELKAACDYRLHSSLEYWRSTSGFEVDFLLDGKIAIEVKAKESVSVQDLKGLKALQEDLAVKRSMVVCLADRHELRDGIEIMPYRSFLASLWQGAL
jgi:predicted AAA+ superfamily ATPase